MACAGQAANKGLPVEVAVAAGGGTKLVGRWVWQRRGRWAVAEEEEVQPEEEEEEEFNGYDEPGLLHKAACGGGDDC